MSNTEAIVAIVGIAAIVVIIDKIIEHKTKTALRFGGLSLALN